MAAIIAAHEDMLMIQLVGEVCAAEPPKTTVTTSPGSTSLSSANLAKRKPSVDASSLRWTEGVRNQSQQSTLEDDERDASTLTGVTYSSSSVSKGLGALQPLTLTRKSTTVSQPPSKSDKVSVEVKRAATGALARIYQGPPPGPLSDSLGELPFQFSYLDQGTSSSYSVACPLHRALYPSRLMVNLSCR